MKKLLYVGLFLILSGVAASAQLVLPMDSQQQVTSQIVGDTKITITYFRPNTKGRANIFGCSSTDVVPSGGKTYDCLVPNGQVWRTGANDNTTIEFSNDVMINGAAIPKGKYGLHMIPGTDEWTVIFSLDNDKWGSFNYDVKRDQLRVKAKPMTGEMTETMSLGFENVKPTSAEAVVRWDKMRVGFTIDIGDMKPRVLAYIREKMKTVDAKDFRSPVQGANWVLTNKMTDSYAEAVTWLDALIAREPRYNVLALKANLLAASGKKADAIKTAEQALEVAKTAKPTPNTAGLEKLLNEWKAMK